MTIDIPKTTFLARGWRSDSTGSGLAAAAAALIAAISEPVRPSE